MAGVGTGELQRRELAVLEALANGMTMRDACLAAGYAPSTVAAKSVKIAERVMARSPLVAALERRGVAVERLADVIAAGLKAERPVVVTKEGIAGGGPDHAIRHRFLETAVRLRGDDVDREKKVPEETYEQRILRLRGLTKK